MENLQLPELLREDEVLEASAVWHDCVLRVELFAAQQLASEQILGQLSMSDQRERI